MLLHFLAQTVKLTIRGRNFNNLDFNASGPTLFLIFFLYGYLEDNMTLDDFSWTDTLRVLTINWYKT